MQKKDLETFEKDNEKERRDKIFDERKKEN